MSIFIPIPLGRIICHAVLHSCSWQVDRDFLALDLKVLPPFSQYFHKRTPLLILRRPIFFFHVHVLNHSVGTAHSVDSLSSAWDSFVECLVCTCTILVHASIVSAGPSTRQTAYQSTSYYICTNIQRESAIISDYI